MRANTILLPMAILVLAVGCAPKRPKNLEPTWVGNFGANLENAGRSVTQDDRSIEGHVAMREQEEKCTYARRTRAELNEMKEKKSEKTALDYAVSPVSNYWALIPGGKALSLMTKDQDELGLYNRNGCWTTDCLDQKIAITQEAVDKYCVADTPGPNELPSVSEGPPDSESTE